MHPTIPTIPGFSLFCVFDGHGGKYAAKYCKTQLPENLFTALRKDDAYKVKTATIRLSECNLNAAVSVVLRYLLSPYAVCSEGSVRSPVVCTHGTDQRVLLQSSSVEQLQSIITTCVFATDNQLRTAQQAKQVTDQKRGGYPERSGCTAVFALITPTDIIVANIGRLLPLAGRLCWHCSRVLLLERRDSRNCSCHLLMTDS